MAAESSLCVERCATPVVHVSCMQVQVQDNQVTLNESDLDPVERSCIIQLN